MKAFDDLVQQIQTPISEETALVLLNLSSSVDSSCSGVEWSLVHAVECLERVLEEAKDGEVKELVKIRLENMRRQDGENDEG